MRIREQSCRILDDYWKEGRILEQIERCGRVCYKSEDRITEGSASAFIKGIISRGHESVLELAQIVLELRIDAESIMQKLFAVIPRFLRADRVEKGVYLLSGNPRSFRDLARDFPGLKVTKAVLRKLTTLHPVLFEDLAPRHGWIPQDGIAVRIIPPSEIAALSPDLVARHRALLVHFTTNRAVTHELVRHRVASYLQESQRYCRYDDPRFGCAVEFIRPCFYAEDTPEFALWREAMDEAEKRYLKLLETSSPQAARTVLPNSCKTEIMVHATLDEWRHILRLRASKAADPSMRELMLLLLPECLSRFPDVFTPVAQALGTRHGT